MLDDGNHGGITPNETETVFFGYSKTGFINYDNSTFNNMFEKDNTF